LLKLAAALAAAVLASACASQPVAPALFAVLPAPDGHVGAIVVHRDGESRVVDTAYGAERLRADGSLEAAQLSPEEVKAQFGSTLAALPGAPATFTLYFREGSDELTPRSRQELDHVFAEIKRRPLPDIVVIGHTDTVGGLRYNDRLSLARAERMREMLIELGIPPERIQARGRGKRELLVPTEDEVSEPRNRRVEINVR
jgi:OmpA-OmpF porin, OOP family